MLNNAKYICQHGLGSQLQSLLIISLLAILTIFEMLEMLFCPIVLPFHMLMCCPVELGF